MVLWGSKGYNLEGKWKKTSVLTEIDGFSVLYFKVVINRGSYMSAHVLLNLLNELGKRDKMRGLPSLSFFRNEFNKFNNTRAQMLDSIYHMTNTLKSHFWRKKLGFCHHVHNVVMDVITFPVNR